MSALIKACRRILWLELQVDPGWRQTYIDNIACVIMDFDKQRTRDSQSSIPPMTHTERNVLAARIFEHMFKEEAGG